MRRFFQLNRLLMWHLPDLYDHFEACGVQTNLYATSWFVTLLSDGGMLPDSEVRERGAKRGGGGLVFHSRFGTDF